MKIFVLITCLSSLLYGAAPEVTDPSEDNLSVPITEPQEMVAFEPIPFSQPPLEPSSLQIPPPIIEPVRKQLWIAVSLSSVFPGLGHLYLGDKKTASGLMGATGLGLGLVYSSFLDRTTLQTALITLQATSSYSIYAAYRDARSINGPSHYSYCMPTNDLADLTAAPFKWSILKKPEVWGGVLGALVIGSVTSYFAYHIGDKLETNRAATMQHLTPVIALPVGVGEESLFRGFLQSTLSESFNPLTGLILSSLAFGAAHIPNAQLLDAKDRKNYYVFTLPFITGIGAYCGWMTQKNHSLQESVAMHTWYDFTLLALSALANQAAATGRPGFAFAIPF